MNATAHTFHVPVMGTGFSLDTPLRIARFGISSVMSLVDDALVERVRRHHARRAGLLWTPIARGDEDHRARRITAYLDLVHDLLERQMAELCALPFAPGNDKTKYFELLPDDAPLRGDYLAFLVLPPGPARDRAGAALTARMVRGAADGNIMTKLDRARADKDGATLGPDHTDAKAALRGFAASRLDSDLVLSAGMNPTLFGLLERCPAFYRDAQGRAAKGLILKVSDFRSASVQARFLAKKGLEVKEFRVESGLNCGGHAFATDGLLLGPILEEFRALQGLAAGLHPTVAAYYEKRGLPFVGGPRAARLTVQGGIGTFAETRRLREGYGADTTGWASPFLLVPEATALDAATRQQLADAGPDELYVSDASPLGVPFNNLRGSSSERWTQRQIERGQPGSPCPHGYLASNTEFGATPLCTASRAYATKKLRALGHDTAPPADSADPAVRAVYAKACICHHLGNSALIDLGLARPGTPVAVCPGPNLAYFDRTYTLRELVDHIYGRGPSLVPASRPHMFALELTMYVDHLEKQLAALPAGDAAALAELISYKENLEAGLAYYRVLAALPGFEGEHLDSLAEAEVREGQRLIRLWLAAEQRILIAGAAGAAA